ncbi:AraC family transcriptional regulator [Acinetobacter guillouiae]|uniref:AraC family transcriptional regulator n=1 Tax=Acinetobacter guillouiae TaxID=106649 RepID=A0A8X8GLM1_ACIGI|nr:AraC family transcriptional regulator [Acinetobacter guillouiae]
MIVLFSLASWLAQPRSFGIEKANQSIDLIIQSVGYLDPSSFCRLFRKKIGLTPLEYRCRFSRRV